jgi:ABC-2 type transport system permease protein
MGYLTLVKPRLWALRNRWKRSPDRVTTLIRDGIMVLFAVFVAHGIYRGVLWMLNFLNTQANLAFLPPVIPLGLVFSLLFAMLLFSNTVAAFGSLYLSKDTELILASPLPKTTFFFGKLVEVLASSSWMALIFGAPVLIAFGQGYNQGPAFLLDALFVTFPLFVIPSAISIILVTLFASVVSAARTKELFLVATIIVLASLAAVARILIIAGTTIRSDVNDFLRILNTFAAANTVWAPPYWVSMYLSEQLQPNGRDIGPYAATLYGTAITLTALAFIAVRLLHFRGYSRSLSGRAVQRTYNREKPGIFAPLLKIFPPQSRALITKDIFTLTRDISQGTQILLLIGISVICLYNFSLLGSLGASLNDDALAWWGAFMIGTSLSLGAFVVSAACTRFVFPSLSLEGQSFWILQTCPLTFKQILRTKLWYWIPPIAGLSVVMFLSGSVVIQAPASIVVLNVLVGLITSYGIVGLAVGLGAYFANFDWEHSSQLIASFGSLVFMLCSVMMIGINTSITLSIVFVRNPKLSEVTFADQSWYLVVAMGLAFMLAINHLIVQASIRIGERALTQRRRL